MYSIEELDLSQQMEDFSIQQKEIHPEQPFHQDFVVNQPKEEDQVDEQHLNITSFVEEVLDETTIENDEHSSYKENIVDAEVSPSITAATEDNDLELNIQPINDDDEIEATSARLVQEQGEYNQRLDLPNFQFPPISLLKKYHHNLTIIDQKELVTNTNKTI